MARKSKLVRRSPLYCGRGAKGKATKFAKNLLKTQSIKGKVKPLRTRHEGRRVYVDPWGMGRRCYEVEWRQ